LSRVLVVASDHVGSSMAGPGIRYLWFARELARRGHEVTLVVPFETDLRETGFDVVVDNPWHARRMTALARRNDAVVAQRLPVPTMLALAGSATRVVYDLYAPIATEGVAATVRSGRRPDAEFRLNRLTYGVALETGDAFVCASERQRDLWLGALAALGRVGPDRYRSDPSLRALVAVVPFGIDPRPPAAAGAVIKGVVPGIAPGDRVALWAGGIWDWLDPLTVIRAVERLGRPELKLVFLGTRRPDPPAGAMPMQRAALALARELGMDGTSVFFNEGWVPFEQRGAHLLEADVGVLAAFDDVETRFAFRTRLLDCVWAGLPVVTTGGDVLAELVDDRRLGRVVAPGDVEAYAQALASVLDAGKEPFAAPLAGVRGDFEWPRVTEPLARLLVDGGRAPAPGVGARVGRSARYGALRTVHAFEQRGVRGIASRLAAGVRRRASGSRAAHARRPS
jgi:glycosyltransferase involved in cell wall biosynthesis